MAKDKTKEELYKKEGQLRNAIRKKNRLSKFTKNREFRKRSTECDCGEDPYCYCGSKTPGVIDY